MDERFMVADDQYDIFLEHIGTPHQGSTPHSGRYPYGSGENPFQRYKDFYTEYNRYKAEGLSEKEIAEKTGCFDKFGNPSTTKLRAKYSNAKAEKRAADREQVIRYHDEGLNNSEIGRKMGIGESTVRSLLDERKAIRNDLNSSTADILREAVDKYKYVDIGAGTEYALGVTDNRLKNAVALLEEDGYKVQFVQVDQMGTDHKTTIKVLTGPDVQYADLSENRYDIKSLVESSRIYDDAGNLSRLGLEKPVSVDPSRVMIRYAEDGGIEKDGLIELRRGVDDISLGNKSIAQVRINVGDELYLKGTARYTDEKMPPGVDMIFNTNKKKDKSFEEVLKELKEVKGTDEVDWDNPFGATVVQRKYKDADGNEHLSALNFVRDEGEWQTWSRNLPSQFLSKQPIQLAERQLGLSYADKQNEYEQICALTNPTVKKKLLIDFADNCDTAAVELKAAPFPGQQTYVISPFPELKDNEIYAPNLKDGDRVALIRYPHGGKFEIAECTVRNTGSPARSILGNTPDAVGINAHVAARLSGADFDGDTVTLIPLSSKVRVSTMPALEELKNFDPHEEYAEYPGMKVISHQQMQTEMGKVSNLITDMTLQGAPPSELARAVKHSMVVIDSEKHHLDWKRSEYDNRILELKKKYQDTGDGKTGAGTIVSRAKGEYDIPVRKDWSPSAKSIDPKTGEKIYEYTGETYMKGILKGRTKADGGEVSVNIDKKTGMMFYLKPDESTGKKVRVYVTEDDFKNGIKTKVRLQKSTRMAEESDAFKLTSGGSKENPGYPIERVYATYANQMKGLGNAARLEWLKTPNLEYDISAYKKYKAEVDSLNNKLALAKMNAPLERQAQLMANHTVAIKKAANPGMDKDDLKKIKGQAIVAARTKVGAKKHLIEISDKEWEAIQNGAISHSKLTEIMNHCDLEVLRQKATPRSTKTISTSMKSLAKSMNNSGYTTAQIAERLGISPSSVSKIVNDKQTSE